MSWRPQTWPPLARLTAVLGITSALGVAFGQANAVLDWSEGAHLATHGYVKATVGDAVLAASARLADFEQRTEVRFARLEEILLATRVEQLRATLSAMRGQRIQLLDLLARTPGDQPIRLQIATLDFDIAATERMLTEAACERDHRTGPGAGC